MYLCGKAQVPWQDDKAEDELGEGDMLKVPLMLQSEDLPNYIETLLQISCLLHCPILHQKHLLLHLSGAVQCLIVDSWIS